MAIASALLIAFAVVISALWLLSRRPGANLTVDYNIRLKRARADVPAVPAAPLSMQDMAALPKLLQRHMQRSGAIGKPPVRAFHIVYNAVMRQSPEQPGMPGTAEQFNCVQPVRRLFFMASRMKGLPVVVLHDFSGTTASMQVRIASLFDVTNQCNAELARVESVTLLNDLCFWAPSALVGPQFQWRVIDESRLAVSFTNGAHTVRATLVFDAEGDLVNFISDDRAQSQSDGTFKSQRWSTPMRQYREFGGRRVPTEGEAIWHRSDGEFVYGTFTVRAIEFDEKA
jgi:hypothetical protein